MRPRSPGGYPKVLPIGPVMNRNEIDGMSHVRVAQPKFPDISVSDGHANTCLDRADCSREVGCRHVAAKKDLIADDDGADGSWVLVRQRDGCFDLIVVFRWM